MSRACQSTAQVRNKKPAVSGSARVGLPLVRWGGPLSYENRTPQVTNLLSVGVFEQFAQQKDSLEFARQHTNEKARHQLELVLAYTGVERPDLSIAPEAQETMDNIKKFNEGKWTPKPKEDISTVTLRERKVVE